MPRQIHYNAAEHISAETAADPYLRPAFSLRDRLRRLIWNICWAVLYQIVTETVTFVAIVSLALLRSDDGAELPLLSRLEGLGAVEPDLRRPGTAGDGAEIYNPAPVTLGIARDSVAGGIRLRRRPMTTTIRRFL